MAAKQMMGLAALLVLALLSFASLVAAAPTGASITSNITEQAGAGSPDSRADDGGTITTLVLNGVQQNGYWKAYVGNVTGVLTLDDASGFTIYNWNLTGVTITGEVYVTRNNSVNFDSVSCANSTVVSAEETAVNMTAGTIDSINQTYNYTIHPTLTVGSQTIGNNTCKSTYTYVNDTLQNGGNYSGNVSFPGVLLQDNQSILVYATVIEDAVSGFDNDPYDFQLIVADNNGLQGSPETYYFYTEIGTS